MSGQTLSEREIGRLIAKVDHLEADVASMRKQVADMHDVLMQAKGSWRALVLVAGMAAALGAMLTKVGTWVGLLPK